MKRSNIARTFAIGAAAALVLSLAPIAAAKDKACSNATIQGAFARTDTGFVISPNAGALPLAAVGLMTFDGNGRWTSASFGSLNGNQIQLTSKGTYTVNPDCTGHYGADVAPPGQTGQAFFVIVDGGNEIQIHPIDQGAALLCVARRVSSWTDPRD